MSRYGALCLSPQVQPKLINSTANFRTHRPSLPFRSHRRSQPLLPQATSITSSASDFPGEHVVGDPERKPTARRPKRRSVAGVDQEELVEPRELADADSFFCEFNGVEIHYKTCHHAEIAEEEEVREKDRRVSPKVAITFPIILLHGFGASAFSWDRVMKPLSRLVGSKVLAFDRPAFGLTARRTVRSGDDDDDSLARPLNPYSMTFSVLATLFFIDLLAAAGKKKEEEKAILIGHSAGCLVAVETYFEAPDRVAALILVAPAIVAPLTLRRIDKDKEMRKDNVKEDGDSNLLIASLNPFMRIWKALKNLCMHLLEGVLSILKGMRDMICSFYTKALSALLRSAFAAMLVRMIIDKFGILAIRYSWFDPSQVTDHVLQGYTKPLKTKGWEMALLEYTSALLTDSSSKPPLSGRLAQISCPVLIITGDSDRVVPSWNAECLSRVIPGSSFEVIKNCGHLPHEERVEEFLFVVENFLRRVFGVLDEQLILAAA
ncbi:unnamed protein product [Musa acuminata subsp. burmannicoides]